MAASRHLDLLNVLKIKFWFQSHAQQNKSNLMTEQIKFSFDISKRSKAIAITRIQDDGWTLSCILTLPK